MKAHDLSLDALWEELAHEHEHLTDNQDQEEWASLCERYSEQQKFLAAALARVRDRRRSTLELNQSPNIPRWMSREEAG